MPNQNRFKNGQLHLLILIPLLWLILFRYVPMYGNIIAFKDYRVAKGIAGSSWVGFKYFSKFFNYYHFGHIMFNTLFLSIYSMIAGWICPIVLALSLNVCLLKRFGKTVQMVTYIPHFISVVVMVGIIIQFTSPRFGIINKIITAVGLGPVHFMSEPGLFAHTYVWSGIWQSTGWGSIIYLAALSGIDPSLHEAALIDGASRMQRVRYVDIPGILPTAVILLIMNAGRILNIGFEKVFLMQNMLNISASEILTTYVYKIGLAADYPNYSYGTAIGLFRSAVNLFLIISVNKAASAMGEVSLW